ncbi:MAG: hypothetical protein MUF20_07090 [Methylotetracoccus sp.]|nr:hypothetical protein [Methylotetracoccus sp.]
MKRKAPKPGLLDRLRRKKNLREQRRLGVCWYTEDAWSIMADAALDDLVKTGLRPVKVLVEANAFKAWCVAHNKPNDAASRAAFVAEMLSQNRAATA